MWEQELNRYPSIVNRQPSTVFKRQPGLQPAIDPALEYTFTFKCFKLGPELTRHKLKGVRIPINRYISALPFHNEP